MNTPSFPKHDPASPEFWDVRYRQAFSPWDAGRVPDSLKAWMDALNELELPRAVLVPGCGSAWEVALMADRGWPVTAIDFSPAAVAAARRVLGVHADKVLQADFFGDALRPGQFDLIYERAFLCALPRRLWPQWAERCAELLKPGGLMVGFFYFDTSERGPPFGLGTDELAELLRHHFRLRSSSIPKDSIEVFRGKERWMEWERV